jgi:anti-sigma-K factor RskA
MNHEDYKEMIPARALSALDAAEDRVFNEHLLECAECSRELDDWQATGAGLALSADPAEPSPQVRERILSGIRDDIFKASGSNVISFTSPPKNLWTTFGSLGAIAAALLFIALLAYVVVLWRDNRAIQIEIAGLRADMQKLQQDLDRKTKFVAMFQKPGTRFSELTGMPVAPGATAKLAYDTSGHAMIMAQGLPAPPVGKEYQLWFIVGNKPMPGKTFSTDEQGKGMVEDQVPSEAMNSAVFAITLERKGGVPAPEGPMYLKS